MKGVARGTTVGERVGQRADDLEEFDDRTGPAVGHDHRHRLRVPRAHVQELDVQPIQSGAVLAEAVEQPLAASPVVIPLPMVAKCADLLQRSALAPIGNGFLFRPAGLGEASPEIIQFALRYVEL